MGISLESLMKEALQYQLYKLHLMSQLHSKPYKILNFEQLFSATNVKAKNCLYKVGEVD